MHNANHHQQEDNIGEVVNIRIDSCCGAISLSSSQRERHFLRRKRSFIPGCRYCHLIAKIYGILDEGKARGCDWFLLSKITNIIIQHYPTITLSITIEHQDYPTLSKITNIIIQHYPSLALHCDWGCSYIM